MKRRYPLAVFLGAFLLFLVQPMAGKRVLPRFGGGPSVWTACMLFFQILLLAGYAYAHTITKLSRRAQAWLHTALIATAVLFLPLFLSSETWKMAGAGVSADPVRGILTMLGVAVGLPYFLLSTTGPLLQAWVWRESNVTSPYRLYALSNIASFLALLAYPVAVEPWLALRTQAVLWCGLFVVYAGSMIWCALSAAGAAEPVRIVETAPAEPISPLRWIFWLALSACGSTLLLAATNHICQEVAVIPFLWVLPLSIYLLTFVLCFEGDIWYNRRFFGLLAAGSIAASCYLATLSAPPVWKQAATDLGIVAAGCMICHGELARSRPGAGRLTQFYLALSAGGALGGVFTALIAPRIFHSFTEFPLAMAACCLLGLIGWLAGGVFSRGASKLQLFTHGVAALALLAAASGAIYNASRKQDDNVLFATRNFFGILRVTTEDETGGPVRKLTHGRTMHGLQFQDDEKRDLATTYYGPSSGIGVAIDNWPGRFEGQRTIRLGMIGLGAGTIAAYGKPGDTVRFYEINSAVEHLSNEYFTYRKDSGARVDVILGDARVKLEEQAARGESQQFDILAVDAFSSDAIPVHLLTAECAALYRYHLKPDGLLALHISNRWLDLKPPARGLAQSLGWRAALVDTADESGWGISASSWVLVSSNSTFFKMDGVGKAVTEWSKDERPPLLWRDDFTSLWPLFVY